MDCGERHLVMVLLAGMEFVGRGGVARWLPALGDQWCHVSCEVCGGTEGRMSLEPMPIIGQGGGLLHVGAVNVGS